MCILNPPADPPRKPGRLVQMKSGEMGRTFNDRDAIQGKIPVFKSTRTVPGPQGLLIPIEFSKVGTLCDPAGLTVLGFID